MNPTTNPTTPPEPQAGATPRTDAARIAHIQWSLRNSERKTTDEQLDGIVNDPRPENGWELSQDLEAALATSRAETAKETERADFAWKNTHEIDKARIAAESQLATLTATLAQREGELEHWKNEMNQLPALVKARTERDTALARVRELECDGRRLDWLERNGQWHDPENRFKVTFQMETVKYTSLRECVDVAAAARAAGTGEEGGRA